MTAQVTEIVSSATDEAVVSALNGVAIFDRQALSTNIGEVEQFGLQSSVPGEWRPVIARRINSHFDMACELIYTHPKMVEHPGGGGFAWTSASAPVRLLAGEHYVGAFLRGFKGYSPVVKGWLGVAPTAGSNGCKEQPLAHPALPHVRTRDVAFLLASRLIGLRDPVLTQRTMSFGPALVEGSLQQMAEHRLVPPMGVRYFGVQGPQRYFCEFDHSLDGWNANGHVVAIRESEFRSSAWWDDHNQEVGQPSCIGKTLSLVAFRYFEIKRGDDNFYKANFANARIQARIRIDDFRAPAETDLVLWVQSRNPDGKSYSNWALTRRPLNRCFDGQWNEIDETLGADPADWTYGGGDRIYRYLDLPETLRNVHNLIFVLTRPIGSDEPSGTFRMDWIRMTYPA